jgi:DNA polymerase-1
MAGASHVTFLIMKINFSPRVYDALMLFHRGTMAFADAEDTGLHVNVEYIDRKLNFLQRKINYLEFKFKDTDFYHQWERSVKGKPVNIDSGSQLAHYLYNVLKITTSKTTVTGQGSVDAETLQMLNIPELDILSEKGKVKKTIDVLQGFRNEQVDGIMHPSFNLHLVRTFRSSSNNPNFQNIPKRDEQMMKTVRKAIFPRSGHLFLELDYSGIEVRVGCCYHKDPNMIRYIKDKTTDMHGDMARQLFKVKGFNKSIPEHYTLRQAAKNGFVFPQFYGSYYKNCAVNLACNWGKLSHDRWKPGEGIPMPGGKTLSDHLISKNIRSLDDFTNHVRKVEDDFWKNRFGKYNEWREQTWKDYCEKGYIDLLTGFRCSGLMNKNNVSNYGTQGAAFHCLLWSFIEINDLIKRKGLDTRLVGQIHDSILLDVNPGELDFIVKSVEQITTRDLPAYWDWIIVPLEIEIEAGGVNESWADKKSFKF